MIKKLIIIITFIVAVNANAIDRYERKSISYINALFTTGSGTQIPDDRTYRLINSIRNYTEMERFDYNPIPDIFFDQFYQQLSKINNPTTTQMAEVLNQTIGAKIVEILSQEKEARAKGDLVDETDRQKFIVRKAAEHGVIAEDLQKVMNSAYIYLPFLSKYKRNEHKNEKEKDRSVSYTLHGGILWFKVYVSENGKHEISYFKKVLTKGWFTADPDGEYGWTVKVNGDEHAFKWAVRIMCLQLEKQIANIDDFKLKIGIREISDGFAGFAMGWKEGVHVDQKYRILEELENGEDRKVGFLFVRSVGDNLENRDILSYGKPVTGKYDVGMQLVELPRLGIEVEVKAIQNFLRVDRGKIGKWWREYFRTNGFSQSYSSIALEAKYDLPYLPFLHPPLSQFFIVGGIELGAFIIPDKAIESAWHNDSSVRWAYETVAYGGLLKKFYFGRAAIGVGARLETGQLDFGSFVDDHDISNQAFRYHFDLRAEYVLSERFNIGISIGYRMGESDQWHYTDDENTIETDGPRIDYFGMNFGIFTGYSF